MGGTISSYSKEPTAEFYNGPTETIETLIKEIKFQKIKISMEKFSTKISHELTLDDLLHLAKKIQGVVDLNQFDGIVITIGTNALEDVAYFIGLVVRTTNPIVFTGAHFPQNSLLFDGTKNLYNAIKIAATNEAKKLGVLVTFNDYVVTARDATKMNAGLLDNFSYDGNGIVGHVIGGNFILKMIPNYKHTYKSEFSVENLTHLPHIPIIFGSLTMDDFFIRTAISQNVKGIVSAGFGKGYQPQAITNTLKKAVDTGIFVVRTSRTGLGHTSDDLSYDNKYGFIVSKGLTPHKSSLLLSVALTNLNSTAALKRIFGEY